MTEQTRPRMSSGRWRALIALGVILLLIALVSYLIFLRPITASVSRSELRSLRDATLQTSSSELDSKIAANGIARLLGDRLIQHVIDDCTITSTNVGITTSTNTLTCGIVTYRAYATATTFEALEEAFKGKPGYGLSSCGLLSSDIGTPYAGFNAYVVPPNDEAIALAKKAISCDPPTFAESNGVTDKVRVFEQANLDAVPKDVRTVWIVNEHTYFKKDLGCGFSFIGGFCGSPKPISADD